MRYELELRSRARKNQPIPEKHGAFFAELAKIAPPWGIQGHSVPPAPDPGPHLGAGVTISKLLGSGMRGQVYYQYRRDFEDLGMDDDFVLISFNPTKVDYKTLVQTVLPKYITAFDAYVALLGDMEFVHLDFDAERAAGLGDCRRGVYRVYPVSFFDRILCRRAFRRTPEEIAQGLEGKVERVDLLHDGVYIIGSSEPLPLREADALCWEMKKLITAPG